MSAPGGVRPEAWLGREWRELRARLDQTSRVLLIGMVVFAAGLGVRLVRPAPADSVTQPLSLSSTVNRLVETTSRRLVPDALKDPATRRRLNLLVVAMLVEALPSGGRERIEGSLNSGASFLRKLFGLPSLATLIAVLVGYAVLLRIVERRPGPG